MQNKPLFSIITVVYNDADNLKNTIESVLSQSNNDYEYIIIDGGSRDKSLEIIRNYADRITTWISESDKGIYDAMNKGIKMAKGQYLNFMNAGDAFTSPETLLQVKEALAKRKDVDIVYGKSLNYSNGEQNLKYITGKPVNVADLYRTIPICHQTMFVRRDLFSSIGLYSTNLKIVSDYEWLIKYYHRNQNFQKLCFLDKPLIVYQQGGASFQNMRKVAYERNIVATKYFPLPYRFVNIFSMTSLILKSYILPLVIKLKIFDVYRSLKYRKELA